jgi:hypothetical protein
MANIEKPIKVEAEVQWAFFNKKNEMSGKYQVDLTNLSQSAHDALEAAGIQVRKRGDKPEKGWHITAKSNYEIKPVDKAGKEINEVVGNGSKAIALIKPYEWKWQAKKGVSPSLVKIIITDLQVYNADDVEDIEEDDIPL